MEDLIDEYLSDEDTSKLDIHEIQMTSLSYVLAKVPKRRIVAWESSNQSRQQK